MKYVLIVVFMFFVCTSVLVFNVRYIICVNNIHVIFMHYRFCVNYYVLIDCQLMICRLTSMDILCSNEFILWCELLWTCGG